MILNEFQASVSWVLINNNGNKIIKLEYLHYILYMTWVP